MMQETILALLLWASQYTGIEYPGPPPELRQVSASELVDLSVPNATPAAREYLAGHLMAIYKFDHKRIYVSVAVDLSTEYGKSIIVHELVHFLQFQTGRQAHAPCAGALEQPAYQAQKAYMLTHGVKPDFDDFTVASYGQCRRPGR